MTRRQALSLALASPLARAARYRNYSRCLPDYLRELARDAYERRNAAIAKLTTPEAIRERQAWARRTFWQLIGGEPKKTPLNIRSVGGFQRSGYKLEKLVYESQPELHVPANLYVPTGTGPFPGVLFQMGHSLNGKAADPYQKCCQALARLGYVVLAFDPMGQGERTYYPRAGGTLTRLSSADDEHTLPGKQMLLVGDTATRMQVWDAVRSLDVLASHPSVDPKRLASTGQSGGGTVTMLLMAADDRLAAAAVSSGNTENFACADFNPPGSVDDAEQDFIGSGTAGFDRWDLMYPFAPRPLLIGVSDRDWFGTYSPQYASNGEEEFAKLRGVYGVLGAADKLQWSSTALPHALSHDVRLGIYNFFEKHLRNGDRTINAEPPVSPETEQTLYVGPTGNVVRDFGSMTPLRLAQDRLRRMRPSNVDVGKLLEIDKNRSARLMKVGSARAEDGITIDALEIESDAGVHLPVWLYIPPSSGPDKSLLLLLEPQGRTARWREGDLYHRLAAAGHTVCAFDVRGIGDLAPEVGRGNPHYTRPHSEEDSYAWASLILGRPLLAQRVIDILAVAQAMSERRRRLVLAARDKMTIPALFAAALDPRIDKVYLARGLKSYASLLDQEEYVEPFANFLPGILAKTDLSFVSDARTNRGIAWDFETLSVL